MNLEIIIININNNNNNENRFTIIVKKPQQK
jgi:prephenate dehydratase